MKLSSGSITTGRTSGLLTLAIGALFYSSGSIARPDLQPLGPNIADKGSAFYHFTQRQYDSADGERHYRVWTAVPDKTPPGVPLRGINCNQATVIAGALCQIPAPNNGVKNLQDTSENTSVPLKGHGTILTCFFANCF